MNENVPEIMENLSVEAIEKSFVERMALQKEVLITQKFTGILQEWIQQNIDHLS